jgi:hypothetical protein
MKKSLSARWAIVSLLPLYCSLCFGPSAYARPSGLAANKSNSHVIGNKSPKEYARLIGKLRAQGVSARSTRERVRQPFLSVPGRIMTVNNEAIQVFEYSNAATTESQAKRVSPDGKTIGNSKPSWMAPPHFFKSGNLIVLYVGANESTLKVLRTTLGPQFAGG